MNIRAGEGKVIVKFRPYDREGDIIIPERHRPESCEGVVVHDSKGVWAPGTEVICSTMDGTYFKLDDNSDERLCHMKRKSVLMIVERDPENERRILTCRPAWRAVIATDEEPEKETAGGLIQWPHAYEKRRDYGKVLAVGPGDWEFAEGEVIGFPWDKAMRIKIDGQKALLVAEEHIHSVLDTQLAA